MLFLRRLVLTLMCKVNVIYNTGSTWRIAAPPGLSHGRRPQVTCTENLVKLGLVIPEIYMLAGRHRHARHNLYHGSSSK